MQLRQFRDRFKGQIVTLVGAAVTTVDYAQLAKTGTDTVVLINWAVRIAPLFTQPRHNVFHFTWHMDVFQHVPEMHAPRLTLACYHGGMLDLPANAENLILHYGAENITPYEYWVTVLPKWAADGQNMIDRSGKLASCANTTLLALMFVWYAGCREINCVGMHDIGGKQAPHYDPRLPATNGPIDSHVYITALEDFCRIMGVKINYLGER